MYTFERQYANLVANVLQTGFPRSTRNADTLSTFGKTLIVDGLDIGMFPILCGRKMYPEGVFGEFAAMLRGPTHIKDFEAWGCNYWKQWANEDGSINVDYGNVWRDFNGVDQVDEVIQGLQHDPYGRRHIITGWKPDNLKDLSLPCCHMLYQFYVTNDEKLEMMWYQRSADLMIGVPSDAIFAAAMLLWFCSKTGYEPGRIIMHFGDTHIYAEHQMGAKTYIKQWQDVKARGGVWAVKYQYSEYPFDSLFMPEWITLQDYDPMPAISFPLFE